MISLLKRIPLKRMAFKKVKNFTNEIMTYINNKKKTNECIDLGTCKNELDARNRATLFLKERYPNCPESMIFDNIYSPDFDYYMAEDGKPSFIYYTKAGAGILLLIPGIVEPFSELYDTVVKKGEVEFSK